MSSQIQFLGLFTVWYAFNAGYNVYTQGCKLMPLPWFVSVLQLLVGLVYVLPLWATGLRKMPKLTFSDVLTLLPIICLNALGHIASVIAMFEKGGGSFTHVVKASEPVVSAILNMIIHGMVPKPLTGLSLLPITYGVAYASTLGNLSIETISREFTTKAAIYAMIGNFCFALRSILREGLTKDFKGRTNLSPANDHAISTFLSAVLIFPFLLANEPFDLIVSTYNGLGKAVQQTFIFNILAAGITFYLYNELQNIVLSSLGPIPTAVGNTLKRVVIFIALYFFTEGETFPTPKIIGCAIAIVGCLAFTVFNFKKI